MRKIYIGICLLAILLFLTGYTKEYNVLNYIAETEVKQKRGTKWAIIYKPRIIIQNRQT